MAVAASHPCRFVPFQAMGRQSVQQRTMMTVLPMQDPANGGRVNAAIFECGPACTCALSCPNRVSQQGLQAALVLGWDARWGHVRSAGDTDRNFLSHERALEDCSSVFLQEGMERIYCTCNHEGRLFVPVCWRADQLIRGTAAARQV